MHPDLGGDPITFHVLQESYDVLAEVVLRAEHDPTPGDSVECDGRERRRRNACRHIGSQRYDEVESGPPEHDTDTARAGIAHGDPARASHAGREPGDRVSAPSGRNRRRIRTVLRDRIRQTGLVVVPMSAMKLRFVAVDWPAD